MGPWLDVALADLEWDDAYLLDRVAAAYPPQRVTWSGNTERPVVTIARTGFGAPISLGPGLAGVDGRVEPHSGGLISFSIDIAHIDFGPDPDARSAREERRHMARYRDASIKLADRVRPMLLVRGGQLSFESLLDADVVDSSPFHSGWACLDRMDERRANGFRWALAGIDHRVTRSGVDWETRSSEVAEQLRLAWSRRPPPRPTRRHG
jgi:hypothetical protein